MRIPEFRGIRTLAREFEPRGGGALVAGAALGVVAVALLSQLVAAFGLSFGVRIGLIAATWAGYVWGRRQFQSGHATTPAGLWGLLSVVVLLWPTWMSFQLDGLTLLPMTVWDWSAMSDLCGFAMTLLTWTVPAAVGTHWLLVISSPQSNGQRNHTRSHAALGVSGFALGVSGMALVAASLWGITFPVWLTLLSGAAVLAYRQAFATSSTIDANTEAVPDISVQNIAAQSSKREPRSAGLSHSVAERTTSVLLMLICGWQLQVGWSLLTEMTPLTLPLGLWAVSVVIWGWCGGRGLRAVRASSNTASSTLVSSTGSAFTMLTAAAWLTSLIGLQWVLATGLIDINLWLSSRVVQPILLEICRAALVVALLAPFAGGIGWLSRSSRETSTGSRWWNHAGLVGFVLAEVAALFWIDPVSRLAAGAGAGAVLLLNQLVVAVSRASSVSATASMTSVSNASTASGVVEQHSISAASTARGSRRFWLTPASALTALLLCSVALPATWPHDRAVKLLFSTPALLGARGGWPANLLTQLDDAHLVETVAGREGRWTLWRSRGSDVVLRRQGVPFGALTTHPEWSPQFAPEVASALWPLALVDQPARVLMLGAGSSASLQTALGFPVSEVVCCEPDAALLTLLRESVTRQGGFDPFADDRCRAIQQPTTWLALPPSERFDVIVSTPATAILPAASAELTTEFYQRAAQRLTAHGVFCQRFSSVDFGPKPLLSAAAALQQAFTATGCLEVGPGEFLLLAAHDPAALVRPDLPEVLERPHVLHLLSRCGWDWSLPLNFSAFDGAALAEAAAEIGARPQSIHNPWLPYFTPRELSRWAPKLHEIARLLVKERTSPAQFPLPEAVSSEMPAVANASRRSRYLEWLGAAAENPALFRRLSEMTAQQRLVQRFPDTHWWEYRKELRTQLQDHPRSALNPANHLASGSGQKWHPEDRVRKSYFESLGAALQSDRPTREQLRSIERHLEPFDPLLTLFAHQELAELHSRARIDPLHETAHRLHVIYYAPQGDASVRNVIAAIDHLARNDDAAASDTERFEMLNGLLQILRSRWEARNLRPAKSGRVTQQEVERSLVSVERAVEIMEPLATSAGWQPQEWANRKLVLDRMLLRPFRTYRDQLVVVNRENERKTRELLNRATEGEGSPDSNESSAPSAPHASVPKVMAH